MKAWKYRWHAEGKRPTLLWYGEHGQLLRRESPQRYAGYKASALLFEASISSRPVAVVSRARAG